MKTPRDVGGGELAECLCRRYGYHRVHQQGSHIVLETSDPSPHRIAVPAHRALRVGTLTSIVRAVSRHKGVSRQDIIDSL
jgi:predicted RNA binding protein YcfA (HicA-like mRNA interferase family)